MAEADLIHHPQPARAGRRAPAQVVTVHDLAPERVPECFDARQRRASQFVHRAAARRAEVVIAVSRRRPPTSWRAGACRPTAS